MSEEVLKSWKFATNPDIYGDLVSNEIIVTNNRVILKDFSKSKLNQTEIGLSKITSYEIDYIITRINLFLIFIAIGVLSIIYPTLMVITGSKFDLYIPVVSVASIFTTIFILLYLKIYKRKLFLCIYFKDSDAATISYGFFSKKIKRKNNRLFSILTSLISIIFLPILIIRVIIQIFTRRKKRYKIFIDQTSVIEIENTLGSLIFKGDN